VINFKEDNIILDSINPTETTSSTLSTGHVIDHKWYLKGGGNDQYPYFLKAIAAARKTQYNQCFEWCCGHGIIGWEILTRNLCNELTFSDCYDLAVDTCLTNATKLGYQDRVTGYVTPTIAGIPKSEKWDLVVGNPPNSGDVAGFLKQQDTKGQIQELINLAVRITVDQNWEAHREFFKNIGNYTTEDVDIFLTMHHTVFSIMEEEIYGPENFYMVSVTDLKSDEGIYVTDPDLKIVHIKKKILTN
jgi:16S rRNA G966 N2-methylase RsmD